MKLFQHAQKIWDLHFESNVEAEWSRLELNEFFLDVDYSLGVHSKNLSRVVLIPLHSAAVDYIFSDICSEFWDKIQNTRIKNELFEFWIIPSSCSVFSVRNNFTESIRAWN